MGVDSSTQVPPCVCTAPLSLCLSLCLSTSYFTIRLKMMFCSGASPDMVIKQTANHEFKVAGGIVSRRFTDSILSWYLSRKPEVSLILEEIEVFSGVAFWTSNQYVDAHESRIKRDYKDKIQEILELKNSLIMHQILWFLLRLASLVKRRSIVIWLWKLMKR